MADKEFKAHVGADISDLNVDLKKLEKAAKSAEKEQAKLNKQIGNVAALKKYRGELEELHAKEAEGIELTKAEVRHMRMAEREAFKLGSALERQSVNTSNLTHSMGVLNSKYKMQGTILDGVLRRKRQSNKLDKQEIALAKKKSRLRRLGGAIQAGGSKFGAIAGMAKGAMIPAAAIGGGILALSHGASSLSEDNKRAQQMGMSYQSVKGMEGLTKNSDVTKDNILDLGEELINKFGDWQKAGGFGKAGGDMDQTMKMAGINWNDIKGLKGEDLFKTVMDKALKLDAQSAQHMFDKVFGGEGNKIAAALKQSGVDSYQDLIASYEEMNKVTQEGIDGAASYTAAMGETSQTLGSAWQEFSGLAMGMVSSHLKKFNAWFDGFWSEHKETITLVAKKIGENIGQTFDDMSNMVNSIVGVFRFVKDTFNLMENIFDNLGKIVAYKAKTFFHMDVTDKEKADFEAADKQIEADMKKAGESAKQAWSGNVKDDDKPKDTKKLGDKVAEVETKVQSNRDPYKKALVQNTQATKKLTKAQRDAIALEQERKSEMYANSSIASAYEGRAASMSNNYQVNMNNSMGMNPRVAGILEAGRHTIDQGLKGLGMSHIDDQISLV